MADSAAATGTAKLEQQPSLTSIAHEDEETPMKLTEVHRNAIRVIRKIKYFVARKKFREALRPYDVKDVIEQYSAGHVDMLARIKVLQFRLDQILGRQGSKDKDVYESKVSLASRIVKVERSVEDIERKLELLIDMYKADRRALYAQPMLPAPMGPTPPNPPDSGGPRRMLGSTASADSDTAAAGDCSGAPSRSVPQQRSSLRSRRSVLLQEQQQQQQERQGSCKLIRNYSDLGPRQPKRVTYSNPDTEDAAPATAVCLAQIHCAPTAASAPSPPPPPVKSLIDFDDDDEADCGAVEAGDSDQDDAFFNAPPPPPPPPPPLAPSHPPLRSALKPMRSCPAAAASSNRHSFTNSALDESEDDSQDQERRRLLGDLAAAPAERNPPALIPMAAARTLSDRDPGSAAAAVAAAQSALMRPELTVKLRKKKPVY